MTDDKKINRKIPEQISRRVVEISLSNPDMGPQRLLALLWQEDIHISKSSIYRIMRRNDMSTRDKRLAKKDKQLAPTLSALQESASLPSSTEQGGPPIYPPEKPKQNSANHSDRAAHQNRSILKLGRSYFRHQHKRFINKLSTSLITLLNLSLFLLLGFIGYQTVEKFLNAQAIAVSGGLLPANDNTPVKSSASFLHSALSDYRSIWERNLFNVSSRTLSLPQKPIDFANVAEADKKIDLKLLGTVTASVSANRFAIIENHQGQDVYHEGDRTGSFVIKRILRNNVIIAAEEGNKLLALKSDDFDRKNVIASTSQTPSETSKPGRSGGRFRTVELPREEIVVAFDDIDGLIEEVGTSSYKFGRLTGFKIGSVSNDSILKKIGLRSRDKILALNDKSIADESEAFEFFERIGDGEKVTITFRRRNRTRRIELKPI
jgi:type II secretion system protein C